MVWGGWHMGELWLAGCHLGHFSCPVSYQLVDEGSQQSRVAVGFTGVFAGGSAPRNSHLFPQSTSPGWAFPAVQAKCTCYHSGLAADPSHASFPGSHSSRAHAEKWRIQNSSLGHNLTFFFIFLNLFSPPGSS